MKHDTLPRLRQRLTAKISELERILQPAFEREPLLPGNLHVSKHRCGKPQCRCSSEGDLHEALRLQIRFKDGLGNRCVSDEEAAFWRPRTEAYRRIREAGRSFRKWQKEVLELLEAIERQRRSLEGLSEEDRKRPLR
jgi:hypothetical protein